MAIAVDVADRRAARRLSAAPLGDDALVLGQRLGEWCGHGPVLEVDLSLANLALDLVGQATLLLGEAGDARPARLPPRRARFQELPAGRAAQWRLRADHRAAPALLDLAALLLQRLTAVERPVPAPSSRPRRSRKSPITASWRANGRSASATAPRKARGAWPRGSTGAGASSPSCSRSTRRCRRLIDARHRARSARVRGGISLGDRRGARGGEARSARRPAPDPRRPARPPQRASRPFARGDAVPAAHLPRRDLVGWPSISTRCGSPRSCPRPPKPIRSASRSRPSCATHSASRPGQHLTLRATIGGEEVRRNYSLCTAPDEDDWMVTVKRIGGGRLFQLGRRQSEGRRHGRRDAAARQLHDRVRSRRSAASGRHSPAGRGSRRSCR